MTLTLLAPSKDNVAVKVEPDRKTIKDSVITFLGIQPPADRHPRPDHHTAGQSGQLADPADALLPQRRRKEEGRVRLGRFQGDIGLNQTKNSLQRIMMDLYKPTRRSPFC